MTELTQKDDLCKSGVLPFPCSNATIAPEGEAYMSAGEDAPASDTDEKLDESDLVCDVQCRTWVYAGKFGDVIIRQDQFALQDEDKELFFRPSCISALIEKLQAVAAYLKEQGAK